MGVVSDIYEEFGTNMEEDSNANQFTIIDQSSQKVLFFFIVTQIE